MTESETATQVRESFTLSEVMPAAGCFEILAITAGEGNHWQFGESVLRESLPLWEGVESFIDHGALLENGRSLRDLAGVCGEAAWDEARQGVRLKLRTAGPSGPLADQLAREWLKSPEPRPHLGFSADVLFTAQGQEVRQILRVLSLDLVFNPARGGAILRALNAAGDPISTPSGLARKPGKGAERMQTTQENPKNGTATPKDATLAPENAVEAAYSTASQTACAYLLEAGLSASRLPLSLQEHLRKQFSQRVFAPADLEAAVEEARALQADLQGGAVISGPGRLSGMWNTEDRLQAAVDDLLEAPREANMRGVKVERLTGLRELYTGVTGDVELRGGFFPQQTRLATTTTLPALVKNAMNKIILDQWEELGRAGYRWWEKVVKVEHFGTLQQITGVLVGEVGALPTVAEGGAYPELAVADSQEIGSWTKYGGYLPLTLELVDRDEVGRLKAYPRRLANAALRNLSALVGQVFTANAGAGPVMKDMANVFHANHNNLGSVALSSASWEAAGLALYDQDLLVAEGETAPHLAMDPKYLLVPRSLRLTAMQLLYPQWERQATIFSENQQRGELGDVVVVPEFTDANDWAAVADPRLAPAIYVGERFGLTPEVFISGDPLSPAMFTNDETRLKVRHFVSVFVADYRPLYKAIVGE